MRGSKAAPILYLSDIKRLSENTALLVMPPYHQTLNIKRSTNYPADR